MEGAFWDRGARGLEIEPHLAIGDGALGFWKAMRQVWDTTREQRCWVHKTANVLDKLPKGSQAKAKGMLHEIYLAESGEKAGKAFDLFVATYGAKYPKATECLVTFSMFLKRRRTGSRGGFPERTESRRRLGQRAFQTSVGSAVPAGVNLGRQSRPYETEIVAAPEREPFPRTNRNSVPAKAG